MQLREASLLVVDDEPVLLEIKTEWLQRIAGRVFSAAHGAQALEILEAHKIDLVITDVRMPVMDGITLLKRVVGRGSHIPFIFITGFADIQIREAYDLGAEALLEKPIEHDELLNIAQRCLLDPNERWQKPLDLSSYPILRSNFSSLAGALREHRIAFGRGGFCIEARGFKAEGPVNFELTFHVEASILCGQGIVRWLANQEDLIGIELVYVAETSRSLAIELTQAAVSFIPRSSGREYQALAG